MRLVRLAAVVAATIAFHAQTAAAATVSRAVEKALSIDQTVRVIALVDEDVPPRSVADCAGITPLSLWQVVPGFAGNVDRESLELLRNDPRVKTIEHDGDGAFLSLGHNGFAPPATRPTGYDGRGITVAVLDSGVDSTHPDLRNAISEERCWCRDEEGRPCCPNGEAAQAGTGAARDDGMHGTHVASTIASAGVAGPRGIAPGAKVVAIRVTEANRNVTWTSQVISAIDWILAARPDIRVVNMSFALGLTESLSCDATQPALADAVRRLRERGVVVVSSSGNDGSVDGVTPPACISGVIAVGAVQKAGVSGSALFRCSAGKSDLDRVACFSNSGTMLDILAPGVGVRTANLDGKRASSAGTSFAAPQVAAAAALVLQKNPSLTPAQVETILRNSGHAMRDPRNGLTRPALDVEAALALTPSK